MKTILIMNGPNLSMLGRRDPKHYGSGTLQDLENACVNKGIELGVKVICFQSESESVLVRKLHSCIGTIDGVVLNAGAYTHYSIAIRDAIELIPVPVMEVHLSDIHNREEFRSHSVIEAVCAEQISGRGVDGYLLAMEKLVQKYIPESDPASQSQEESVDPISEELDAIDTLDAELLVLFQRRMKHVDRIARLKAQRNTATFVPGREAQILAETEKSVEPAYAEYAKNWMKETMRLARERQEEIRNEL